MPRPPGHGPGYEIRRQEIIDLAAELFAKRGYAATGIAEICAAVGLAKGALYYYIGSKENLLVEIQYRVMQPLLAVSRRIARLDADPLVRLRLLSEELLRNILRRLDHIRVYEHDHPHLSGQNRTRFLRQRDEFEGIITNLLSEAIDRGTFREMHPRLAMLQFLNLHNHTYQWVRPDGAWDAGLLSHEYCTTLFNGFSAPGTALPDTESLVRDFRRHHPDLVLDPRSEDFRG